MVERSNRLLPVIHHGDPDDGSGPAGQSISFEGNSNSLRRHCGGHAATFCSLPTVLHFALVSGNVSIVEFVWSSHESGLVDRNADPETP